MTAFGGIFRVPAPGGLDDSGDNGERGRIVGLDLDSGVVRVQPAVPSDSAPDDASEGRSSKQEP